MLATTGSTSQSGVRLVKGSHIVVPKLFDGRHAYMLQQPDGRIVFAIAYAGDTTLIGTTDVPVELPEDAQISDDECDYLIDAVNRYFKTQIARAQILKTYSGVRPLYDDGASEAKAVTRDYVLELDGKSAPLLSVFGGKITTARQLAEDAMEKLAHVTGWPVQPATRAALFPGGEIGDNFAAYLAKAEARWPFLGNDRALRMARAYGAMLEEMLADISSAADMGKDFGGGLTQIEVDWLVHHEWAQTAEDILFRRTKIGLATGEATAARLSAYLSRLG